MFIFFCIFSSILFDAFRLLLYFVIIPNHRYSVKQGSEYKLWCDRFRSFTQNLEDREGFGVWYWQLFNVWFFNFFKIFTLSAPKGQKRVSSPPELELQRVVRHPIGAGNYTWVVWRTGSDLNHWAISPHPIFLICCQKIFICFLLPNILTLSF